jgi:hypothetical protein
MSSPYRRCGRTCPSAAPPRVAQRFRVNPSPAPVGTLRFAHATG